MKKTILILYLIASSFIANAQRPGGGPEEALAREKQVVLEKVENLSADQKALITGIYDEFTTTLKETFEEARSSGNREGVREKIQELRAEKDLLMQDVLDEEQFAKYKELTARKQDRERPTGEGAGPR